MCALARDHHRPHLAKHVDEREEGEHEQQEDHAEHRHTLQLLDVIELFVAANDAEVGAICVAVRLALKQLVLVDVPLLISSEVLGAC